VRRAGIELRTERRFAANRLGVGIQLCYRRIRIGANEREPRIHWEPWYVMLAQTFGKPAVTRKAILRVTNLLAKTTWKSFGAIMVVLVRWNILRLSGVLNMM
jgi:hypothetical protein